MKLKVEIFTKSSKSTEIFELASDGWWECKNYIINPAKTKCRTDPWFADYICPAPEHEFKIIEEIKE